MMNISNRMQELATAINAAKSYKDIMESLDGRLRDWVISDLAAVTKTSKWQVSYGWVYNNYPCELKQDIISEYFNRPARELFPERKS